MKQFSYFMLSLFIISSSIGNIIIGSDTDKSIVNESEKFWLRLDEKPDDYTEKTYGAFKKACVNSDLETINTMLVNSLITPAEIGYILLFLEENIVTQQCLDAIASKRPYALWDGYLKDDHHPFPSNAFIKKSLDQGFIIPYKRANQSPMCTSMVPVLHYFLMFREWKKGVSREETLTQDPKFMEDVDYAIIEKLLQAGANPHYVDYFGIHKTPQDAFYFTTDTRKPEEGPKLKALLDKYVRTINTLTLEVLLCTQQYPLDILNQIFILNQDQGFDQCLNLAERKQITYNTTDMFYPGTICKSCVEKIIALH
jgi:hypothetical protein